MKTRRFAVSDYVTSEEIKDVRKRLGLTQKEFGTVDWKFQTNSGALGEGKYAGERTCRFTPSDVDSRSGVCIAV